jgi:AcrR family transcriptional regulator
MVARQTKGLVVQSGAEATSIEGGEAAGNKAPTRRLPREDREARIIDAAAAFFAEVGLDGRTRDLAKRMGVSQALIYRYFPSKQNLIDRVFSTVFVGRWDDEWDRLLGDASLPLEERLIDFYQAYSGRHSYMSMRLFMFAGLAGGEIQRRYSFDLTDRVFAPIIDALRRDAGLPPMSEQPMVRGERELAMMLHGSIIFLSIRKFVYQMKLPETLDDLIAQQVRTFLGGAGAALRTMRTGPDRETLDVPLVRR